MKKKGVSYSILVKPREKEALKKSPMLEEVKQLLDQFKDINCEGTLDTLPPKIEISHQIDFLLEASLRNKVVYKMTPKQNKEIEKKFQELLVKV